MLGKVADSSDDGENKFRKSVKCMECYIVGAHTVGGLFINSYSDYFLKSAQVCHLSTAVEYMP